VMFIISLIVAACAPAATPAPAPAATKAPEPVKTEAPAAQVGGQLNILGWEGYDDPTVFKPFYDENKVVPNSTYIGNNDEVISKYKAGGPGVYDIGDINSRYLKPMIAQGMLMPLDESKIPNLAKIHPAWNETKFGRGDDGKLYAVPAYLGFSGICYRADLVPAPTNWNYWKEAPYNEKYAVTTNPLASMYIWAMTLGKGQDASKWTKQDLDEIKAYGMEKWKGAKTTASSIGEQTDLLVRGDVTTTDDCFDFISNQAQKQGVDVKVVYPEGPKKIWVDAYFILNGAKNIDTGYAWINYALSDEAMAVLAKNLGTAVSNQDAYKLMDADLVKMLGAEGLNDLIKGAEFNVLPNPDAKDPYVSLDDVYKAFDEIKASAGG
jgi:spermidine/putrescine transport system substrate-binding protein